MNKMPDNHTNVFLNAPVGKRQHKSTETDQLRYDKRCTRCRAIKLEWKRLSRGMK